MDCLIRKVQQGDEFDLAYIQTESWKAAFKDILSAEILQMSTNLNRATAMYKRLLDENVGNGYFRGGLSSSLYCMVGYGAR